MSDRLGLTAFVQKAEEIITQSIDDIQNDRHTLECRSPWAPAAMEELRGLRVPALHQGVSAGEAPLAMNNLLTLAIAHCEGLAGYIRVHHLWNNPLNDFANQRELLREGEGAELRAIIDRAREAIRPISVLAECLPNPNTSGGPEPDATPTPTSPGAHTPAHEAPSPAPHPDGVDGGCWLWWAGARHDIPKGVSYRLIAYMWDKESAPYDNLEGPVFEESIMPDSLRARVSDVNKVLKKISLPWRLSTDSTSRILTKQPAK